jgi:myo-inositol-1(or 4)-monophosphatase
MRTDEETMLSVMIQLVKRGGELAVEMIHDSRPGLKSDKSVITAADHAISRLAHESLDSFMMSPGHILVDEEDEHNHTLFEEHVLDDVQYIWSIDPIDGTRLYANKMPCFGVSIGVLKDLKPFLGAVYFPMMRELFYASADQAKYVSHAFTDDEEEWAIVPVNEELSDQSVFFCHDSFFETYRWQQVDCRVMIMASAVVDMCWPAIGRGCGSLMQPSLWDFAGSWPIVVHAGLQMRNLRTGDVLDHLDRSCFGRNANPWELKEPYLVCRPQHFEPLRQRIQGQSR